MDEQVIENIVNDLQLHLGDDVELVAKGLLEALVKIAYEHQYEISNSALVSEIKIALKNFGYALKGGKY